jgi:glycosidase
VNEPKASAEELKLAFTALLTARGVPMIYYGDEIGLAGGGDPDNRRDFPGGWAGDAHNAFLESGRTPQEQEIFAHVQRLIALRKSDASLAGDRPTVNLYSAEQQWAFLRGSTVVLINNDAKRATIELKNAPNGEYADGLGGLGDVTIRDGMYSFALPARSASVLVKKGSK